MTIDRVVVIGGTGRISAPAAKHHGTASRRGERQRRGPTMLVGCHGMPLVLNMPINRAIFRWDEERGDPDRSRSRAGAGMGFTPPGCCSTARASRSGRRR